MPAVGHVKSEVVCTECLSTNVVPAGHTHTQKKDTLFPYSTKNLLHVIAFPNAIPMRRIWSSHLTEELNGQKQIPGFSLHLLIGLAFILEHQGVTDEFKTISPRTITLKDNGALRTFKKHICDLPSGIHHVESTDYIGGEYSHLNDLWDSSLFTESRDDFKAWIMRQQGGCCLRRVT